MRWSMITPTVPAYQWKLSSVCMKFDLDEHRLEFSAKCPRMAVVIMNLSKSEFISDGDKKNQWESTNVLRKTLGDPPGKLKVSLYCECKSLLL